MQRIAPPCLWNRRWMPNDTIRESLKPAELAIGSSICVRITNFVDHVDNESSVECVYVKLNEFAAYIYGKAQYTFPSAEPGACCESLRSKMPFVVVTSNYGMSFFSKISTNSCLDGRRDLQAQPSELRVRYAFSSPFSLLYSHSLQPEWSLPRPACTGFPQCA